jgi:hypothetical protein
MNTSRASTKTVTVPWYRQQVSGTREVYIGAIQPPVCNLLCFGPQNRLFEQNATEREKRRDWLAERIGFELTVEFHKKFRVHWRQNVDISSEP